MEQIVPTEYNKDSKATMTITFEKGIKVIAHPSGTITKYDANDLKMQMDNLLAEKERIEIEIKELNRDLESINPK